MRVSKKNQALTKRQIMQAAVRLISEHGYDKTTMKDIARAAHIGDATIYNYFTNKDNLLFGFYELNIELALEQLQAHEAFSSMNLAQKFQNYMQNVVKLLSQHPTFVDISRHMFKRSPALLLRDEVAGVESVKNALMQWIHPPQNIDETERVALQNTSAILHSTLDDFIYGTIHFWFNDTSHQSQHTMEFIEANAQWIAGVITSGVLEHFSNLMNVMVRQQIRAGSISVS